MMIVIVRCPKLTRQQKLRARRRELFKASGLWCGYCGIDLLSDPRLFETLVLDHFHPKHKGGSDNATNRVVSCSACDRIKSGRTFDSIEAARAFIERRHARAERLRQRLARLFR